MRKLNIAFVLNAFPLISETFILNQIIYLIDQGHTISIYSLYKGDYNKIHNKVKQYELIEKTIFIPAIPTSFCGRLVVIYRLLKNNFSVTIVCGLIKSLNFLKFGRRSLSLYMSYIYLFFLDINQYDIIHGHFGNIGELIANLKRTGLINKPKIIISFHGSDISPDKIELYKVKYKNLFKYTDLITLNSLYSMEIFSQITNKYLDKVVVLPVGLDIDFYVIRRDRSLDSCINILFCGRLIPMKGVKYAIDIIHNLIMKGYTNLRFTIVGEGPEETNLLEQINNLGLETKVFFYGSRTQEELVEVYENSDIFLFSVIKDPISGRCETQGLVVQEAQAMELPVVVSNVGGVSYGVLDNVTGFVVGEGDINGFVDALDLLIQSPDLRKKMGKKGREFIKNNFDIHLLGNKLELIYLQLLRI